MLAKLFNYMKISWVHRRFIGTYLMDGLIHSFNNYLTLQYSKFYAWH